MKAKTSISRWLFQVLIGFLASIYIISIEPVSSCRYLWIVPLIYAILSFVCIHTGGNTALDNVTGIMFNGVMLLRAVIMPVLMAAAGMRIRNPDNMVSAIFLFSYEIIVEYAVANYFFFRMKQDHFNSEDDRFQYGNGYWKIIIFIVLAMVICLIMAPMAIGYYRTIFGLTDYEYTGFDSRNITRLYATSFVRKLGLVTFRYIMNVVRVIIPAIVILYCKKKNFNRFKAGLVAIIFIFIFNFLIVDDTIATSIFNALIISIYYRKIYNENTKGIMRYLVYAVGAVMVYFAIRFSINSSTASSLYRVSSTAQAYFGGLENISAGLSMQESDIGLRLKYAIYEVLRGIPYASTIFGLDSTNISNLFNRAGNTIGQIVPTICSSKLYFGYVLSPIYGILFLYISLKESKNIENEKRPLYLLSSIIICVYSLMGISAYSPEITWTSIICVGLVTRLVSIIFEKGVRE